LLKALPEHLRYEDDTDDLIYELNDIVPDYEDEFEYEPNRLGEIDTYANGDKRWRLRYALGPDYFDLRVEKNVNGNATVTDFIVPRIYNRGVARNAIIQEFNTVYKPKLNEELKNLDDAAVYKKLKKLKVIVGSWRYGEKVDTIAVLGGKYASKSSCKKKTTKQITYDGMKYVVYEGPRGGKYIKQKNGKFVSIKP